MNEKRLMQFLKYNSKNLDDALGFIAGNYIDIGGSMVGLTTDSAVKAMRFVIENYDEIERLTA